MDKLQDAVTNEDLDMLWKQVSSLKIRVSKIEQYARLQNDLNNMVNDSLKKMSTILKNLYINKNYDDDSFTKEAKKTGVNIKQAVELFEIYLKNNSLQLVDVF